jgi:hypothetical protein
MGGEQRARGCSPCWGRDAQACRDPPGLWTHSSSAALRQCSSSPAIKQTTLSIIQQQERGLGRKMHLCSERGAGGAEEGWTAGSSSAALTPCQVCLGPDLLCRRADSSFLNNTIWWPLKQDLPLRASEHLAPPLPGHRNSCADPPTPPPAEAGWWELSSGSPPTAASCCS